MIIMSNMRRSRLLIGLSLLLSVIYIGCSGGGSSDPSPPPPPPPVKNPAIEVLPSSYNFGAVTPGNLPAPLNLRIQNTGSARLNVSSISLGDNNNFQLDFGAGSYPCFTPSPTIDAGSGCTVGITFVPKSTAPFSTNLTINSNDPDSSTLDVSLNGSQEDISQLNVKINQIEISCVTGVVTAYVSVTDQGGYSVTTLAKDDFDVTETGGYMGKPSSAPFVDNVATLSAALVLDYSTSITDRASDMQRAASSFVSQLGGADEAEIIKFGPDYEVVQPFTSDKDLLVTAIDGAWNHGPGTLLYDTVMRAIDDTSARPKDRRAVIVISDGRNHDTINTLDNVVAYALSKHVPIFTVGLGDNVIVANLTTMANGTGGQYYEAETSDNLIPIYQKLADVLLHHQYIITYISSVGNGSTDNTTIKATLPSTAIFGTDTVLRPSVCQ